MNAKVKPQEPRRCPVCAGPWDRYDLQSDKCVCLFGHVYEPGARAKVYLEVKKAAPRS